MKDFINQINNELKKVFINHNYDEKLAYIVETNRPDICDYQINSSFQLAKLINKNPFEIAESLVDDISKITIDNELVFSSVTCVKPAFINLILNDKFLNKYLNVFINNDFLIEKDKSNKTIIIDYGGANVAKPLHIGHLRSAVIGEAIKRLFKKLGYNIISDIHLGDFGLQMGLVIAQLIEDKNENSFTLNDLEIAYPKASKRAKDVDSEGNLLDKEFNDTAHLITKYLQEEKEPYFSIWKRIIELSVEDLKKNYQSLNVSFDLWKGESDVNKYIPNMIKNFVDKGYAYESNGALVIDVKEDNDKIEVPPCLIRKNDGSILYATTDLATIIDREKLYNPDMYIYVVDKRQSLHFVQVFRAAKLTKIAPCNKEFIHIGFGTMNGKDGKVFKTRDGNVLRLETLVNETKEKAKQKLILNGYDINDKDIDDISNKIAISALKYGDLSNQASKDYVFDIDNFLEFSGNTGPYILYTIVRINSIINKLGLNINNLSYDNFYDYKDSANDETIHNLLLNIIKYNQVIDQCVKEIIVHPLCKFAYDLSNSFNSFYHLYNIINEKDENKKKYYTELSILVRKLLLDVIDILGFESPNKM